MTASTIVAIAGLSWMAGVLTRAALPADGPDAPRGMFAGAALCLVLLVVTLIVRFGS